MKEEQNLRIVPKSPYIFLTKPDEVEKYVQPNSFDNCVYHYNVKILNLFDPEVQLINTKPVIKSKLKKLLNELKSLKFKAGLVLDYMKRNGCKIFHSSAKLIASDSHIHEAFKSMNQSIMKKKNASEDWIALDVIVKHSIEIFNC